MFFCFFCFEVFPTSPWVKLLVTGFSTPEKIRGKIQSRIYSHQSRHPLCLSSHPCPRKDFTYLLNYVQSGSPESVPSTRKPENGPGRWSRVVNEPFDLRPSVSYDSLDLTLVVPARPFRGSEGSRQRGEVTLTPSRPKCDFPYLLSTQYVVRPTGPS